MAQTTPTVSATRLRDLLGGVPTGRPAYAALAEAVRVLVLDGRVLPDSRLPSERDLALALGTSRTTVTRAYGELVGSGWATARRGSGTTVAVPGPHRSVSGALLPHGGGDDVIDLTVAAAVAPPGTAALVERAVEGLGSVLATSGYEPIGTRYLRERIAARYAERGLPTDPDQVLVVPGALAGLSVVAHALLRSGDRVLVESPSYPNSIGSLRTAGARVVAVPVGPTAWDVDAVVAAVRRSGPRLVYLIPDFHNPTGMLMDAGVRERLGTALRRLDTTVVVDESLVDLAHDDGPAPTPLGAYDDRTISIGSVTKALWGGFRVGWVRHPAALRDRLVRTRVALELGSSALDQLVAAAFFDDPAALLGHRRSGLRATRDAWDTALRTALPAWSYELPAGGTSLWVRLAGRHASAMAGVAERHGLALAPGTLFAPDGTHEHRLRLPLTVPVAQVPEAVRRLVLAEADAARSPATDPHGGTRLLA